MHTATELSFLTRLAKSQTSATSLLQNLKSKPKIHNKPPENQTLDIRLSYSTLLLSKSIMSFLSLWGISEAQVIQR